MTKQLVDLSVEEKEKVDKFSRFWKINYTQTIKKMIREYPDKKEENLFGISDNNLFGMSDNNLSENKEGERLW